MSCVKLKLRSLLPYLSLEMCGGFNFISKFSKVKLIWPKITYYLLKEFLLLVFSSFLSYLLRTLAKSSLLLIIQNQSQIYLKLFHFFLETWPTTKIIIGLKLHSRLSLLSHFFCKENIQEKEIKSDFTIQCFRFYYSHSRITKNSLNLTNNLWYMEYKTHLTEGILMMLS